MLDWIRKAAQGVGNFIYNSTPVGGAIRSFQRVQRDPRLQQQIQQAQMQAQRAAQQAAQQVQRQIPKPPPVPRINLPKINLTQASKILNDLNPGYQAGKFVQQQAPKFQDFTRGAGVGLKFATNQRLNPDEQRLLNIASQNKTFKPVVDFTKWNNQIKDQQRQRMGDELNLYKKSPATFAAHTLFGPVSSLAHTYKSAANAGINLPKFDTTKGIEDASQALAKTRLRKVPGMGVVGDLVKATLNQGGRALDVAQTQENYSEGMKGGSELLSDIATLGSLFYTGGLARQIGQAPVKAIPGLVLKYAPRMALSGSGQNILTQVAGGKKLNDLDLKEAAISGAAYAGLGSLAPLAGRAIGKGLGKLTTSAQASSNKVAKNLNDPVTVKTWVEKAKLQEQGYTNVKVKFNGATHAVQNDGVVTELAPKGIKGVKLDPTTKEAVQAGALPQELADAGFRVDKSMEYIIDPSGKKYPLADIQKFTQDTRLTAAEEAVANKQMSEAQAQDLTTKLGKGTPAYADDFRQPRSPNGRYGNKEFNPELEQLKAYQTEQLQVLQRANQNSPEYRGAMDNYNSAQKRIDALEQPKVVADTSTTINETVPRGTFDEASKGGKKRGFVQTVQDSEFTEQPTRVMLDQSDTFTTKSNKLLEKKANEMITADVTNARAYAMNNTDDQAVATAGQLIKYYQAKNDFGAAAQIADDVAHRLTEAGRTIQAASLYNKLNPEGILQYASSKVQKAGKTLDPQAAEVLTNLAKKIEKMADGEDKQLAIKEMMDIIGRAKGSAISDKIITLWKSGLLTSPVTTAGNLTSNTFKQIVKKASDDPIAAVTDMMFSVVTGKRTKTFTGRGLLGGAGEGSARGIKYFKTGYDIRNPIDKLDSKQVYFSDSWAGKVAQTYSDSVFRLMGAQDQPYFYAALRNTLYDQALAAAKNQGVKGQARDQFIKKFVNNTPSDIMDVATEEARQAVFQNKTMLSSIASKINQSDNTAVRALGQFLMPFSKVPSAVATEIFDRTPLGAAKEIVKQVAKRKFDQRAMSNAIAKSTTGTVGIMGLGYALDRGDSINLAFPQSETERNLWELEGRQPFSVKVGDKWVSLNYVQPFGSLIAMGAQYHRSLKDGGGVQDALASSAAMGAKAVTEQSFLRGVGGALGALQDPARQAERYVEQTAGSVIPNFIRTTARATDPVQRQINNAGEAVIAGIPGLRQTLLPKQNVFGQEIARADSPLGTMINPFRPTTAKSDPTIEELRRLYDTKNGVLPSEFDKSVFGKDKQITPAQINELQASVGQPVLERWQKIMSDYRYKRLSDEDKAKVLKDARDAVSRGEKYAFAQDNGLGDTKLDKDSVRYLEGNDKDYLARDLPKRKSAKASSKPKRVAKAKKGRKAKVGRIAKSSAPKLRSIKLSAGKVPKISRTAKVKFRRYA